MTHTFPMPSTLTSEDETTTPEGQQEVRVERLEISARDGRPLVGDLFLPDVATDLGRVVQIHPATAVRRGIYAKLAQYLAERGLTVVTFDYRGTGDSLRVPLRENHDRMRDWGELDIPGVIDWVAGRFPEHRHLCVAHSVGGQILGLAPNNDRFDGVWAVASQWGSWRLWPWPRRWVHKALFHVTGPAATAVVGYFPGRLFGMGNLPRGIGLEWMRWCASDHYVCDDEGEPLRPHYHRLRCPVIWNALADDPVFGPRRAVEAMPGLYPAAHSEVRIIHPREAGGPVGHFGFFRSRFRDTLWRATGDWLTEV